MNDPRITLPIARLAADPERKQTRNGTPYMFIRVAATGGHMDKTTKQWVDHDTMWATIFEYDLRLAETYERMLRKGTPVRVEGVLKWKAAAHRLHHRTRDHQPRHAQSQEPAASARPADRQPVAGNRHVRPDQLAQPDRQRMGVF